MWGELQNTHLYRNRQHLPTKHSSGQKWQVAIITVIWEQWYMLWKLRNEDVHGKDAASRAIAETQEVSRNLTAIYDQRNHMEPSSQSLLFPDIRHHLEQPPWVIQNWIRINGPEDQFAQCESNGNSKRQINSNVFRSDVRHLRIPSCILLHLLAALLRV